MIDPNTKFRISWPGFSCKDEEEGDAGKRKQGKSKKGKEVKSKKAKEGKEAKEGKAKKGKEVKCKKGKEGKKGEEGEGDADDCGCCHVYRCRNWCSGVKACCLSCCEAMGDCPRCTCFHVRTGSSKFGRCVGGCLAGCLRLCGGVFSVIVALVGCFGMLMVLYFLYQAIFDDDAPGTGVRKKMKT